MKYKQGLKILSVGGALLRMINGEVVWYINGPIKLTEGGFMRLEGNGWYQAAVELSKTIYEAIEVPEYNLTFMEAWEEMKKGKVVEREVSRTWGAKMFLSSGIVKTSPNGAGVNLPPIHGEFIEGRYRVVEGA